MNNLVNNFNFSSKVNFSKHIVDPQSPNIQSPINRWKLR